MWTPKHEALLNALRGDDVIPLLFLRLSQDRYVASSSEVRKLRDWIRAMSQDPAWALIKPALSTPRAWPAVWARAETVGFSPRTDHHSALVLRDLATRFAADRAYPQARRCFAWYINAYRRVFASDYPQRFVQDVTPAPQGWDVSEVFAEIFLEDTSWLEDEATEAMANTRVDQGRLTFAAGCLSYLAGLDPPEDDCFDAMEIWSGSAQAAKTRLADAATRQLDLALKDMDVADGSADAIATPFERVSALHDALGANERLIVHAVSEAVEILWRLRHANRDEGEAFRRILDAVKAPNIALAEYLRAGSAFGHNSKCSDFLLFEAEMIEDDEARKAVLETSLRVCPGHRNSLMLLSYVYLRKADLPLAQLEALPSLTKMVPGRMALYGRLVANAENAIAECESIFAFNKSLDTYKERLQSQCKRLKMEAT